jgi:MYXO-CTERM domain-containing protein
MPHLPNNKTALTTLASLVAASSAQASIMNGAAVAISAIANGGYDSEYLSWNIDGEYGSETAFLVQASTPHVNYSNSVASVVSYSYVENFGFLRQSGEALLKTVGNNSTVGSEGMFANSLRLCSLISFASSEAQVINSSSAHSHLLTPDTPSPITVGFRFDRDGATHYGVAELSYKYVPGNEASLNLYNVKWNDVAGQGITGSAVPEPASAATALGLLALGAAGLRRMRKTKAA